MGFFPLNFSDKPLLANECLVFSRPKCLCAYKVSICKKRNIITPFNTQQKNILKRIPKIAENQNLQDSSRSSFLVFVSVVHHLFPPRISTYPFLHPFYGDFSRWNPHIWVIQKSPIFFLVNSTEIPKFSLGENHAVLPIIFWTKSHEIPRFF